MAIALCTAAALAACTTRESAQPAPHASTALSRHLAVVGRGEIDGVRWRVDLLKEASQLCTEASVDGRRTGRGCAPPVSRATPINVAVDGLDSRMLLLYGATDPSVARLVSRSTSGGTENIPLVDGPRGTRFFAYGTRPGTAADLMAVDTAGRQMYSAADKIRQFQAPTH
ncbi:hypothetical protein ACPEIC_39580 [Stenotrophomonas sp. NPDC087984]